MPVIEELQSGVAATIYVYKKSENDELFLKKIEKKYPYDFKQLVGFFQRTCHHCFILDERKYKPLTRIIHEFKTKHIRILSFRLPGDENIEIVITDYFKKPKSPKMYKPHIERAEKIAKEVVWLYQQNKLEIIR